MLHRDDFQGLLHGVLRRSGGRSVHALSGDIDLITGDALVTRVREIADGANPFDLDMADVAFIDSTGLRSLFRLHDVVTARGGRLRLLHPSETVMRQLELTHTADQFEIVRTAPGDAGAR
ncbi:MAG TPA: STAS domain-containing protein [Miltoncostaeaceae bacterium]|jgi:anti-anti-sigma factor|nr:STAS domain-containing protein [Miltoncostaeaceae bacterium]